MTDPALTPSLELDAATLPPTPFPLFRAWLEAAQTAELPQPLAMTLATADGEGRPAARTVLLRGFDERGFVFFTHYESRKAQELAANPWAALVFYWDAHQHQVRVEGAVSRVAPEESDAYFASRPRGSQLGAWASPQSQPLPDRAALDTRLAEVTRRFEGQTVPRPPFWGGYRVAPTLIEFWQGRTDRLHDRVRYQRHADGWSLTRLAP